ncbi:MAG: hypothetical protein MJ252_02715 [archaeon]|nr:hypothetical protein [archaeon]
MKYIIIISLLCLFSPLLCLDAIEHYSPSKIIETINTWSVPDNFYTNLTDNLIEVLDRYVFLDILKNPIQPFEGYHTKVDLLEELKNLGSATYEDFYPFYQSLRSLTNLAHDAHFNTKFTCLPNPQVVKLNLTDLRMIQPLDYKIKKENNAINVYAKVTKTSYINETDLTEIFGKELIEQIKSKEGQIIESISDKDPVTYIAEFGKRFNPLRNSHASFSYVYNRMNGMTISSFPMDANELEDIVIKYKDGSEITFSFTIILTKSLLSMIERKNKDFNSEEFSEFLRKEEKETKSEVNILEALDKFYKTKSPKNKVFVNKKLKEPIKWEYVGEEGKLKCRIDSTNKVNVYYQNSFSFNDMDNYYSTLKNCLYLFDGNVYPIVIIQDHNGGGAEEVTFSMQELIQNKFEIMNYNSFRDSKQVRDNLNMIMDEERNLTFAARYHDQYTCTPFKNSKEMFEGMEIEDYGEGAIHKHTQPFIMTVGPEYRQKIDNIKLTLKRKIKPTDIIVFTDSFSYSCTCFFIRAWQEFGGAIMVGYNGNPKETDKEKYDACQSPSGYLDSQIETKSTKELKELGYVINSITTFESFSKETLSKDKPHPPREFEFKAIDERVDIYEKYSDEENYDLFLQNALTIFKKYETGCNPKNKNLILDSWKCDDLFESKVTHGGFPCGTDGKWNYTKCVPYYCDMGYYFDQAHKICVQNPCNKLPLNSQNILRISIIGLLIIGTILL